MSNDVTNEEIIHMIAEMVVPFDGQNGLLLRRRGRTRRVVEDNATVDDSSFIPCEVCNQMIRFDDYAHHIDACIMQERAPTIFIPINIQNASTSRVNVLPRLMRNILMGTTNDYESNLMLQEMMGGAISKGISNKDNVTSTVSYEETPTDAICTICQDAFTPIKPITKTNCNHYFCRDCIYTWLDDHNTCPNCFKTLDE